MWYRVFADGSEVDIIHANNPSEAITIAKGRHADPDDTLTVWTWAAY